MEEWSGVEAASVAGNVKGRNRKVARHRSHIAVGELLDRKRGSKKRHMLHVC